MNERLGVTFRNRNVEGDRGVCPCETEESVGDKGKGDEGEVREKGTCGRVGREKFDVDLEETCPEYGDIVLEDRGHRRRHSFLVFFRGV